MITEKLYDFLHSKGIIVQIHYIPIHTFLIIRKIGYLDADLTNSEKYYSRCISLPMYPTLKKKEQEFVIEQINNFIDG